MDVLPHLKAAPDPASQLNSPSKQFLIHNVSDTIYKRNIFSVGLYSIKDLSQLTSIKTHTIRMWEKRYGILKPKRTESNNRYYCESEVTLLSNIAFLNQNGFKIGKIAALTEDELNHLAERTKDNIPEEDNHLDKLTSAIIQFDEDAIEQKITTSFDEIGIYETMLEILLPIAARLNLLLVTGKVQQVHIGHYFNIIKKIFIAESARLDINTDPDAPHLVLFPYASNKQYVSVAALNCCLKSSFIRCTELGQDTLPEELRTVYTTLKPHAFVTVIHDQMPKQKFSRVVDDLVNAIGNTPLYVICSENGETASSFPANVRLFPDIKTLVNFARSLARVPQL